MKRQTSLNPLGASLLFILLVTPLLGKNSFSGYYKLFFTTLKLPELYRDESGVPFPPMGMVNNRLRLSLSLDLTSQISVQTAYDFSPRIQDSRFFNEGFLQTGSPTPDYRIDDLSHRLYPGSKTAVSSFGIFQNLDRCQLTVKTSFADIIVGRQAIAWGSGKIVNPSDVISPFSFSELDTEERRGQDAVRIRIPLGMMDELDMGFIGGEDLHLRNSAFFLRGRFNLLKTDIALLLMDFKDNLLLGIDLTRAIGGAGFWLESAYVKPKFWHSEKSGMASIEKAYFRTSLGMDTNLTDRLYGFFEYHFNGSGSLHPEEYPSALNTLPYREGTVYLLGRHYINLGATFQLSPLIPMTGLLIWNLGDGSFIAAPSLEYNLAENIYLAVGAYFGIGKGKERTDAAEFSLFPDMVYTSIRLYF